LRWSILTVVETTLILAGLRVVGLSNRVDSPIQASQTSSGREAIWRHHT